MHVVLALGDRAAEVTEWNFATERHVDVHQVIVHLQVDLDRVDLKVASAGIRNRARVWRSVAV